VFDGFLWQRQPAVQAVQPVPYGLLGGGHETSNIEGTGIEIFLAHSGKETLQRVPNPRIEVT
jgi:hypothetical protein